MTAPRRIRRRTTHVRLAAAVARALAPVAPGVSAAVAERLFFTPPRAATHPPASAELAHAEARWMQVSGVPLRVYRWGRGPAVALVHGWGGHAGQMASALASALVRRGFSAVAFDAPAHGASGGRLSSIPEIARALLAVNQELGPLHAAVGHSAGAAAIAFAMEEGLSLERATLIAPAADPARWTREFASQLGLSDEVVRRLKARSERRLAFRWEDLPMARMLSRTRVPVLVVHDREDREVPWQEGALVADSAARGMLITTSGLGHRRIVADAEVASLVADFTAGHSVGERAGPPCGRRACGGTASVYGLCDACALEAELFDPARRWLRASP